MKIMPRDKTLDSKQVSVDVVGPNFGLSRVVHIDNGVERIDWTLFEQTPELEYSMVVWLDQEILMRLRNLDKGRLRLK
jgi:hypothetical protein